MTKILFSLTLIVCSASAVLAQEETVEMLLAPPQVQPEAVIAEPPAAAIASAAPVPAEVPAAAPTPTPTPALVGTPPVLVRWAEEAGEPQDYLAAATVNIEGELKDEGDEITVTLKCPDREGFWGRAWSVVSPPSSYTYTIRRGRADDDRASDSFSETVFEFDVIVGDDEVFPGLARITADDCHHHYEFVWRTVSGAPGTVLRPAGIQRGQIGCRVLHLTQEYTGGEGTLAAN